MVETPGHRKAGRRGVKENGTGKKERKGTGKDNVTKKKEGERSDGKICQLIVTLVSCSIMTVLLYNTVYNNTVQ